MNQPLQKTPLIEVTCNDEKYPAILLERIHTTHFDHVNINDTPILIESDASKNIQEVFTRHTNTSSFFLLSVLTKTAAKTPLAHIILKLLHQKIDLLKSSHDNVVTVLHEAILNAIIHGNCGLESNYTDRESFLLFQRKLDASLADPIHGEKRIIIEVGIDEEKVILCVSDEGNGNDGKDKNTIENNVLHGRGLGIISHYCKNAVLTPEGNTIIMEVENDANLPSNLQDISNDNLAKQQQEIREALKSSSILLVDDQDFNLLVLTQILESSGFTNFQTAKNGLEALEKVKKFKPDLVVLDLLMPEMDGFEFCKQIRKNQEFKDMPIVVQTALTIPEQRLSAFEAGATDFIGKPVDPGEMIARILVHLERQKLFKELVQSRQRMAKELDDARTMQKMIMPSAELINESELAYHLKISSFFQPSSELGGDFWGVKHISHNMLGLYIVDFSGHGVTAALNTFRLHALMNEHNNKSQDPGLFLTELNYSLTKLLSPGQFATMFYGVINCDRNELAYAAAASTNPILYSARSKTTEIIDGTGFPLGIAQQSNYDTKTIPFLPGDALCMYSDALIETEGDTDVFLQEEELRLLVSEAVSDPSKLNAENDNLVYPILTRFKSHIPQLSDDLTISFYYRKV